MFNRLIVRVFMCLLLAGTTHGAPRYKVVILHPSGFSGRSAAYGISDGQQVGLVNGAALWSGTAGSYLTLHPNSFDWSYAYNVSGGQQVGVCYRYGETWIVHASLWSGTLESRVDLHPSAFDESVAHGVFGGQQVGWAGRYTPIGATLSHALLWSGTAENYIDLNPSEFYYSEAYDISDGQQVGKGASANFDRTTSGYHALLWSGTPESYVDLHPSGFYVYESCAYGVSGGQQVGVGNEGGGYGRALLWSGTAESCVSLHPSGFLGSVAYDVCAGWQVGWGQPIGSHSYGCHALLWSGAPESCVDLHAFLPADGYTDSRAYGIDSNGDIVGCELYWTGEGWGYNRAVMWVRLPDVVPPVVSTSPATDVTKSSATLNGILTDDGGEACQYRFRYREAKGSYIYTPWSGSATSGQSFTEPIGSLKSNATYYFNAQAKNSEGESAWGNEQSFVARAPEPPIASFKYSPERPRPLETIMFDASQSRDPDGTTQSYEWDFGDGEPPVFVDVDLPFIWYAYERPGEYTVTLTVTDNDDLPDTVTRAIKITGKRFMITFDDGPSPESTPYILDQLKGIMNDEGTRVKAGFFLIGEDKSRAPRTGNPIADDWWQCQAYFKLCPDPGVMWNEDIVRRIKKEGHLIGIHTQHHPNLRDLEPADAAWEVLACYDAILKAGVTPPKKVFRPPYLKAPIPLPAALEEGGWSVIQGELTDDWLPEWRPEWLPEWLPSGSEEHVIAKCRDILQQSTDESPTVLIFHDFRGREDYRLDFCNIIVNELVNKDGFVLVDFEY